MYQAFWGFLSAALPIYLLTLSCVASFQHEPKRPVANTSLGSYIGYYLRSSDGRYFSAFSGIRYAQPPIGQLRFKAIFILGGLCSDRDSLCAAAVTDAPEFFYPPLRHPYRLVEMQDPVPIEPSKDVRNAIEEGSRCIQIDPFQPLGNNRIVTGSEDCLYLNVYTHNVSGNAPVMLWIHGGLWKFGSGSKEYYGPDLLMNEDVVLVTINYRLGPLGFASLANKLLPGNLGLKDQEEAIRWVKNNIACFGGDPNQITLFGQSAGGSSALFHLNGRMRGFVQRGIAQSGSSLSPWAFGEAQSVRKSTINLATLVGCRPYESDIAILTCLQQKTSEELISAESGLVIFIAVNNQDMPTFRPVIEDGGVLSENPWNAEPSSHPILIGHNSYDGGFFVASLQFRRLILAVVDVAFNFIAPRLFLYQETAPNPDIVTKKLRRYYLDNRSVSSDVKGFIEAITDAWYTFPIHFELLRHRGVAYSYVFDYIGSTNIYNVWNAEDIHFGPGHMDELPYLFRVSLLDILKEGNSEDLLKSREMVKIWTNFAKGLDPTPYPVVGDNWDKWSRNNGHLLISNNVSEIVDGFRSQFVQRNNFWSHLPLVH